jgi:hypothetical protein
MKRWVGVLVGVAAISAALGQAPRHFVIVIATASPPEEDPIAVGVFETAMSYASRLVFDPTADKSGRAPYRFGVDDITIIEGGPGPKPTVEESARKGHWKTVCAYYARPTTLPAIRMRKARFAELFRPFHANVYGDPEVVLAAARTGGMLPKPNGRPTEVVAVSIEPKRASKIPDAVAAHFELGASPGWMAPLQTVHSERYSDRVVFSVKTCEFVAPGFQPHPLGQTSGPLGSRLKTALRWIGLIAALGACGWVGRWAYVQARLTKHFELWLPGYAGPFELPPIAQSPDIRSRTRLPRYEGEPAAFVHLPHRAIRLLFYRSATLNWDPRLKVEGLAEDAHDAPLLGLPRFVTILWVERPAESGMFELSIARRSMLGSNERINIAVSFFALPRPALEPLPAHDHEHSV